MRILFAGNKNRGAVCLQALVEAGHEIAGVLAHPGAGAPASVAHRAASLGIPVYAPPRVNGAEVVKTLAALRPELIVLAGYSQIVGPAILDLAPHGCINLHAGKLPQYRGSSPMNWALINGETEFTISILQAERRVDAGDVLSERTFPIGIDDTIADLQRRADEAFPGMLLETVDAIGRHCVPRRKQDEREARYYPLRFPEDGLILFDRFTVAEVHNRIRALTDPYPGAFTYLGRRKVKLLRSRLASENVAGEPGRIYRVSGRGWLVCARDRCLWIEKAVFAAGGEDALGEAPRYGRLATLAAAAELILNSVVCL